MADNKGITPPPHILDAQILHNVETVDSSNKEQIKHSEYLKKSKTYKGYHYSVLSEDMIEYLHKTTLKITEEVLKIFNKHNIHYMICGGTLLGAATTGKFIPWDDDVDICVLEDDYEKMRTLLIHYLPDWIEVQCSETEKYYYHGWIKIRDKYSTVFPNEPKYKYNGVWLDLYKLTLVKRKEVPYLICKEHIDYLYRRCDTGCISMEERDSRIDKNNLIERLKKASLDAENSTDDTDLYIIWSASKILIEKEWTFPTKDLTFEGLSLKSFNNPDAYLRRHYGDNYTVLPSYELRRVGINKILYP